MGIYNADTNLNPTTLVVDGGTIAADTTGIKTASIGVTLTPGRYLLCINSDGTPTFRRAQGGSRILGFNPALGAGMYGTALTATQTFAAFPGTGTAPTSANFSSSSASYLMFVRISTP